MSGILYDGMLHEVPGLNILSPGQEPWVRMDSGDFTTRPTTWIRQITVHTTKGDWPQTIRPGSGPSGEPKTTAAYWSTSNEHGGAHFVIGSDGQIACLIDIGKFQAYHATTVNPWSVGIEMYQESDNSIYEETLDCCVKLVLYLCDLLGIPFQGSGRVYHENGILQRLLHGGPDVVGVYGHRDNAWDFTHNTSSRGTGDPGNEIFARFDAAGKLNFDIDSKGELQYWTSVQEHINHSFGTKLALDGICGPGTVAALRKYGLWEGGVVSKMSFE